MSTSSTIKTPQKGPMDNVLCMSANVQDGNQEIQGEASKNSDIVAKGTPRSWANIAHKNTPTMKTFFSTSNRTPKPGATPARLRKVQTAVWTDSDTPEGGSDPGPGAGQHFLGWREALEQG